MENTLTSLSLAEKIKQVKKLGKTPSFNYLTQIEGVEGLVAYKGPLANVIERLTANMRSGLSYVGAKNIRELWEKAKFIRVSPSGFKENHAHDILLISKYGSY